MCKHAHCLTAQLFQPDRPFPLAFSCWYTFCSPFLSLASLFFCRACTVTSASWCSSLRRPMEMCSAGWRWAPSWTAPRRSPPPRNPRRRKRPSSRDPGGTGQSADREWPLWHCFCHLLIECWSVLEQRHRARPLIKWRHNISHPITVIRCVWSYFLFLCGIRALLLITAGCSFIFFLPFFALCPHLFSLQSEWFDVPIVKVIGGKGALPIFLLCYVTKH